MSIATNPDERQALENLGRYLAVGDALHGLRREMTTPTRSSGKDHLFIAVGAVAAVLTELHMSVMELARQGRALSAEALTRPIIEGRLWLHALHEEGDAGAERYLASAYWKRMQMAREIRAVYGADGEAQDVLARWQHQMDAIAAAVSQDVLSQARGYIKELRPRQGSIEYLYWQEQSDVVHLGAFTAERVVSASPAGFVFTVQPDYRRAGRALYVANASYLIVLDVVNDVFGYGREQDIDKLADALRQLATGERGKGS